MSSPILNIRNIWFFSRKPLSSLWCLLIVGLSVSRCLDTALAEEISWTPRTITVVERHYTMVFSPDSKTLLTHSTDGKFRFWAARTGALIKTINAPSKKRTLAGVAPDGSVLCRMVREKSVTAMGRDIKAYRLSDMPSLLLKWDHEAAIGEEYVTVSRDRRLLAVSKSVWSSLDLRLGSNPDVVIELWDVSRGQLIHRLKPKPSREYGSTPIGPSPPLFSYDNKILATNMSFAHLRSPGGYVEFQLWDTQNGRQSPMAEEIRSKGPKGGLLALASSPVAPLLACEGGEAGAKICLADVKTGEVRILDGHTGQITALTFSPDGKRLASGSEDRTVRLWDVESGKTVRILRGHEKAIDFSDLAFAPDGSTLASSDGSTIKLWRIR